MVGRLAAVVCSLSVGLALASCAGGSSVHGYSEDDRSISAETGQRFRIELEASPGVGDDWTLVGQPDPAVARLEDEGFASEAPEDVAGAPGVEYFLFEAIAPGSTEIVFRYCYRGCGGEGAEPERRLTFDVTVSS